MFPNINCKQAIYVQKHSFSNIYGLRFSLKIKSERINICTKFSNCRWMKMAKIDLTKQSGKRSKVSEKSGNFENDIEWQPCSDTFFLGL